MTAVLDTSAAVRVVLDPGAAAAFSIPLGQAGRVLAPELMIAELTNVFWKYLHGGYLSRRASERGLETALQLVDEFAPVGPLRLEAFDLAALTRRPAYDMFFLVLARRNGAVLLTADDSLRDHARRLGIRTEWKEPES